MDIQIATPQTFLITLAGSLAIYFILPIAAKYIARGILQGFTDTKYWMRRKYRRSY